MNTADIEAHIERSHASVAMFDHMATEIQNQIKTRPFKEQGNLLRRLTSLRGQISDMCHLIIRTRNCISQ